MKRTGKRGILPNNKELSPTLTEVFWRESVNKEKRFRRGNEYSYSCNIYLSSSTVFERAVSSETAPASAIAIYSSF